MTFSQLATYLQQIEQTSKRLEMTELLAKLYRELDEQEIQPVSYLLQGKLVPKYEPLEFQLSTKMMFRVLARFVTTSSAEHQNGLFADEKVDTTDQEATVEKLYKKLGDIGTVAEKVLTETAQTTSTKLSVTKVFEQLLSIAQDQGTGSQERKVDQTVKLLKQLDPLSARYVIRIIVGKLRLGFSDMTMIDALSWALRQDKSLSGQIEDAYQKRADIGYIARVVLTEGSEALEKVEVSVGTPIMPALCQRLNSAEEIIDKMGTVLAEPKYDGTRVQIHFERLKPGSGSKEERIFMVKTFTRNLEENSHMFPELNQLTEVLDCQSCILDAEAIGYDPNTGNLLPFQATITRKRKHGVSDAAESLPLRFFIFDILAKDGQSLLNTPLTERKKELQELFSETDTFVHAPVVTTADPTELHQYHESQLAEGLEGLVMKKHDSPYQSGRKGYSWVKIKESEGSRGKLSDTLDCVVMGYNYATGVRTDFIIGALLVGVVDSDGQVRTISKVGSGLTEELAKELVARTEPLKSADRPPLYQVNKQLHPDVWLKPELVIEVAADEITKSPLHTAEVALRFPRIVQIRKDKDWEQATTMSELEGITHLKET